MTEDKNSIKDELAVVFDNVSDEELGSVSLLLIIIGLVIIISTCIEIVGVIISAALVIVSLIILGSICNKKGELISEMEDDDCR